MRKQRRYRTFIEESRHAITETKTVAVGCEIYQKNVQRLQSEIVALEGQQADRVKAHLSAVQAKQDKLAEFQELIAALDAEDAPTADSALACIL